MGSLACWLSHKSDDWWLGCGERAYICVALSERDVWVGASPSPLNPVLIQPPYQLHSVCTTTAPRRPVPLPSLSGTSCGKCRSFSSTLWCGHNLTVLVSFVPITRSSILTARFPFEQLPEIMKLQRLCFPTYHLFTGNLSCECLVCEHTSLKLNKNGFTLLFLST